MDQQERSEFVNSYTKVLTRAWSDNQFVERLEKDPETTVTECGLSIPEGAHISLVRAIPSVGEHEPTLDRQVELWDRGQRTGLYELHVPHTPQIDMAELSEGDLMAARSGDITCCCCPCCSCT